jgi:nucleoside phosphorylase
MVEGVDRPTGARVAQRLRELRGDRQLTLAQLAERLTELGHPLQVSVLSKIEKGHRRIDADDIIALALALDVSPNRILLPSGSRSSSTIRLTAAKVMTERQAWLWASQDSPLDKIDDASKQSVVILVGLDIEYAAIRELLDGTETVVHSSGTRFEIGLPHGATRKVALALVGEGNVSAAVIAERAIAMFRPSAILFVGVAGALHLDIALGDVVVATRVYTYGGGAADDGFRARPRALEISHGLEQLARYVARQGRWIGLFEDGQGAPSVHFRPIASGQIVLNSRTVPLANQVSQKFLDAAAVEMESGGVQAAHLNRSLPTIAIRGISDIADGKKNDSGQKVWIQIAARHAAAFAVSLVTEMSDGDV